jgi:hypothetical protein
MASRPQTTGNYLGFLAALGEAQAQMGARLRPRLVGRIGG